MQMASFWGKAQPAYDGPTWHPLVCHSLDVAAVGREILGRHPALARALAGLLGWSAEETTLWCSLLLGCHDLGKFARWFQAKVPERLPSCFADTAVPPPAYDHGAGGLLLYDHHPSLFGLEGRESGIWRPLMSAVTGHHGAPPSISTEGRLALRRAFGDPGIAAAQDFVAEATEILGCTRPPLLTRRCAREASHLLAGLAVLCDWIGSAQRWFRYHCLAPECALADYWPTACERAARAVAEAGILPSGPAAGVQYDTLLGAGVVPTPMQRWAEETEIPESPALFMIEDETGSGKTEAALMLAHRLMARGHGEGLYVALPTMATANGMFDRVARAYRSLFAAGTEPSIALAHGGRDMHAGFSQAILNGAGDSRGTGAGGEGSETASAACAEWIADDRRRSFLADAGAGTIDQALLAVLPARHQSLRLLGLSRRILVLDEVHAYDPYMQREIEALLEFHAGLGGSAVLLSATLPTTIRNRLAGAFSRGLAENDAEPDSTGSYPLATVRSAGRTASFPVSGDSKRARTLPVRLLRSVDAALDEVARSARAGKAVLYIRNTVDDALEAHAELSARGLDPRLFHARFALDDRLQIERRVMKNFGKTSGPAERRGRVLVATQVVEQSLDLDFDAMVTDLAPIDLLIQRAGRLWRHEWRERSGEPELVVVAPEANTDPDERWFARMFPRAAYVYSDQARLWLTARAIEEAGEIASPSRLRALVEAVYGEKATDDVPEAVERGIDESDGIAAAERSFARPLSFGAGYLRDGGEWDSDVRTRLQDDPHVTLRLARVDEGGLRPYAPTATGAEPWRAWRLSEVSVPARRVGGEAVPTSLQEAARIAKGQWGRYDGDKILVVLEGGSDSWVGTVVAPGRQGRDRRGSLRRHRRTTMGLMAEARFNLIDAAWLPLRRRDGSVEWRPPWAVTDGVDTGNPFVAFAWPRADFNAAAHEFLIGLLTTAAAPSDEDEWIDLWEAPPPPGTLAGKFRKFAHAFDLDGDGGPRFGQDLDDLANGTEKGASALLIDAPGDETLSRNTDLFVKRGTAPVLSRPAAAMALFTLTCYAPSGGRGHNTSVRGGGPMSTLVVAPGRTLWGRLWPNVETGEQIVQRSVGNVGMEAVFPWCVPTRTSDSKSGGRDTTPEDVHPLHVYWGVSRRIRLNFEEANGRLCGLTGRRDETVVTGLRTLQYGNHYTGFFDHPLSPSYTTAKGVPLPKHPKPGSISYRLWPGMVFRSGDSKATPAPVVRHWMDARAPAAGIPIDETRLVAHGYAMKSAKARAWVEGEVPLWQVEEPCREQCVDFVDRAVGGAEVVAAAVVTAVKGARYARPSDAKGDYGFIKERFYRDTEREFQSSLQNAIAAATSLPDDPDAANEALSAWCDSLHRHALRLFDELAPADGLEDRNMERHVRARHGLASATHGYGKIGKALYKWLGMAPRETRSRKGRREETT